MTDGGDGGGGADGSVGGGGGGDALATANAALCVGGGRRTEVTVGGDVGADGSVGGVGVGDALGDGADQVFVVTVVGTLWPLPMLLSVPVATDRRR